MPNFKNIDFPNKINEGLSSVTTPINELNRFLGKIPDLLFKTSCRSGYNFQDLINPESAEIVPSQQPKDLLCQ